MTKPTVTVTPTKIEYSLGDRVVIVAVRYYTRGKPRWAAAAAWDQTLQTGVMSKVKACREARRMLGA